MGRGGEEAQCHPKQPDKQIVPLRLHACTAVSCKLEEQWDKSKAQICSESFAELVQDGKVVCFSSGLRVLRCEMQG